MPDFKKLGPYGERLAAEMLDREGYEILERNLSTHYGELDIIALDGKVLVFIEVKTRQTEEAGSPFEAVTPRKQRQIARSALCYATEKGFGEMEMRFDVVGVEFNEAGEPIVELMRNAFVVDG